MIIIVYNEERTITRILSCTAKEDAQKLGLKNYKIYDETNACVGLSLDFIDEQGMIKSDKQLLEENLIQLQEDEVLEGEVIRKLTVQEQVDQGLIILKDNEEIRGDVIVTLSTEEMKEKFPERYPNEEVETPSETEQSELEQVEQEISSLEYEAGMEIVRELGRQKLLGENNA